MSKTKKQVVFEAATQLFREKGYKAASMRELAERVGLKQASSLYNHFKSKEIVLQKICFENADKFISGIDSIERKNISPAEKIKALIQLHISIATEDITSVTVFNDEWRHLPETELTAFLKDRNEYEANFKALLRSGMDSGEFVTMSESTAFQLVISSVKWIHYSAKRMKKEELDRKRDEIKHFISRGLFLEIN